MVGLGAPRSRGWCKCEDDSVRLKRELRGGSGPTWICPWLNPAAEISSRRCDPGSCREPGKQLPYHRRLIFLIPRSSKSFRLAMVGFQPAWKYSVFFCSSQSRWLEPRSTRMRQKRAKQNQRFSSRRLFRHLSNLSARGCLALDNRNKKI